jgi:hypothetical protein
MPRHPLLISNGPLPGRRRRAGATTTKQETTPREREATLMSGSITLGEVGEHTAVLIVSCTRCERAGQYRLETLIERHGKDFGIPDLLGQLSDDCLKRKSIAVYDLCGVHCPELPGFFLGKEED